MNLLDEAVKNWGFPEILLNNYDNLNFDFFYKEQGNAYGCRFLVKDKSGKILFTMDFHMSYRDMSVSLSRPTKDAIKIDYIQTGDDKLRRKGIAKYYIDNLKTYAKSIGIEYITLDVCAQKNKNNDEDPCLNVLNKEDLKAFYTNFSDDEIQFIITN